MAFHSDSDSDMPPWRIIWTWLSLDVMKATVVSRQCRAG